LSIRPLAAAVAASGISLWLSMASAGGSVVLGHANLISSSPGAGSVVDTAPTQIRLAFSEPIESRGTSADVLDSVGQAIVVEGGEVDPADPYALVVPVPALANGTYTVQWRSLSAADGHVSQGFFTFAIGAGASPPPINNQGGGGDIHAGHSAATALLETIGRASGDAGAMLLFGLALVGLIVVLPIAPGLGRHVVVAAAAASAMGAVGALLLAISSAGAAGLAPADYITGTRNGVVLVVRAAVLVAGAVTTLVLARRSVRASLAVAGVTGIVAISLLAAAGHSGAFSSALPIVAMVAHVAAAGTWLTGLLVLATLALAPRQVLAALAVPPLGRFVPRFSALALVAAALFGLTGLAFAGELAGGLVVLDSPYGVLVGLKIVLALAALGLGGLNFLAPRRSDDSPGAFRWRIPLEAMLALVVVVVGALLASGSPPAPLEPVALARAGVISPTSITLALEPARPGPQRFVATVGDSSTAEPAAVDLQLQRVDVDQGTSLVAMRPDPTDAHAWVSDGGLLVANSSWSLTVVAHDAAGGETARQRFEVIFGADRLTDGAADRGISLAVLSGIALLALSVLALTMGLAGGSLPKTPPRLGRWALIVGAVIAGPIGVVLLFGWRGWG
jgi:copper transport protein